MLSAARRVFRKIFPRRRHPLLDAELVETGRDREFGSAYRDVVRAESADDDFVTERYAEGQRWRGVLDHFADGGRVIDIGAGNGAIELALMADEKWRVVSVDRQWNETVRMLRSATGACVRRVIADIAHLPFRSSRFDVVTCLETIEHLADARSAASEMARVTRPGGLLLVTTPPRFRFALRRDPHFGIPGLLLFPAGVQRTIAARQGFSQPHHFVDRIYSSTRQLERLFSGYEQLVILSRSRAPRRWFWDALIFRRRQSSG